MHIEHPNSPTHPSLEYVTLLVHVVNPCYSEFGQELSEWGNTFHLRLQREKITPPFSYQDFLANTDVIATIEGYSLDVAKFWFVLLFIYDLTQNRSSHLADVSKADFQILSEISGFLQEHPTACIYLSDDEKVRKNNSYKIGHEGILRDFSAYIQKLLARFSDNPTLTTIPMSVQSRRLFFNVSQQQVLMFYLFSTLFAELKLGNKRSKTRETVSYSKTLLISRLIYFSRLCDNENFLHSDTSIKGVLKQYGDFDFNATHSNVYYGSLCLKRE